LTVDVARRLITLDAAGALLGVSGKTIRRRIADGSLPCYRRGRYMRVLEADVLTLLEYQPGFGPRRRGRAA
jgi:excisionase family DNA binding protein